MDTGFSFADVYDEVVSRAGGEQTTAEDVARVQRGLRLLLERWEAKGYNTWRLRFMDFTTPTSTNSITLGRQVDDVVQVVRKSGGELRRIAMDRMMVLGASGSSGTPGTWALLRQEPPQLVFYPHGQAVDLRVWYVERPEDYERGQANISDVPGRWLEAMILGLAYDFARKRPPYDEPLIARLRGEALEAEDTALRADRDRAPYRRRIVC